MELYDSFLKITYDPDAAAVILLNYGDALWGPVELDGGQLVQEQGFVRAVGIKAFARGNERHTLKWEMAVETAGLAAAFAAQLNAAIGLPRGSSDMLISISGGAAWRLQSAAIRAWGGGQEEHITRQKVEIVGGAMVAV